MRAFKITTIFAFLLIRAVMLLGYSLNGSTTSDNDPASQSAGAKNSAMAGTEQVLNPSDEDTLAVRYKLVLETMKERDARTPCLPGVTSWFEMTKTNPQALAAFEEGYLESRRDRISGKLFEQSEQAPHWVCGTGVSKRDIAQAEGYSEGVMELREARFGRDWQKGWRAWQRNQPSFFDLEPMEWTIPFLCLIGMLGVVAAAIARNRGYRFSKWRRKGRASEL